MAERVGFEPTVRSRAQRFSRPPRSTTLAPLRNPDRQGAPWVARRGRLYSDGSGGGQARRPQAMVLGVASFSPWSGPSFRGAARYRRPEEAPMTQTRLAIRVLAGAVAVAGALAFVAPAFSKGGGGGSGGAAGGPGNGNGNGAANNGGQGHGPGGHGHNTGHGRTWGPVGEPHVGDRPGQYQQPPIPSRAPTARPGRCFRQPARPRRPSPDHATARPTSARRSPPKSLFLRVFLRSR